MNDETLAWAIKNQVAPRRENREHGSLAALKRRMQVGKVLLCVENTKRPELNGRRREIVKVQGNSFAWVHEGEQESKRSWTDFPQAKGLTWLDEHTFKIDMDGCGAGFTVTLQFVKG